MTQLEPEYQAIHEESEKMNETRDCAVKAVALACSVPYSTAHDELLWLGRVNRRTTPNYLIRQAIKNLGYKLEPFEHRAKTVRTLARELRHTAGTYLVWTPRHVLCIRGGKVLDWTKGRLNRINRVERVSLQVSESLCAAASDLPKV